MRAKNPWRRRTGWNGFWPRLDRGLWPQRRWLWWTWDLWPETIADSLGKQVDDMRGQA